MKTKLFFTVILAAMFAANTNGQPFRTSIWAPQYYYADIADGFDLQYSPQNVYAGAAPVHTSVNEQGASVVTLPLDLPDAGNTLKPDLALYYNSMHQETMFGNEWGLSGLSQIRRVDKSVYYDGVKQRMDKNAEIDGTEAFTLNGMRLISTDNDFANNTVTYQSETGNIKVTAHIIQKNDSATYSHFDVRYPNGKTAVFGFSNPADNKSKLQFPITGIEDRLGNAVHYDYIFSYGEYRISRISFGKNFIANVDFAYKADTIIYQKRVDISNPFNTVTQTAPLFHYIATNCILSHITVKYYDIQFRTYHFNYSANSERIFISSINVLAPQNNNNSVLQSSMSATNNSAINIFDDTLNVVLLQNDTADFMMPVRFRYAKNEQPKLLITSDSLTTNYSNIRSAHGVFGSGQTNGIVIYPKDYSNNQATSVLGNIYIKPDTDSPVTYTIEAGEGFVDLLCVDLNDSTGNEIVKINNISTNDGDVLIFTVYTINSAGALQFLYTRQYTTAFEIENGTLRYKEFFVGDFDGNGQNEILAVSALNVMDITQTEYPDAEMYDLTTGQTLYQNTMFDNVSVYDNTPTVTPAQMIFHYKTTLMTGDFNGDGKTDLFYRPRASNRAILTHFNFENSSPQISALGTNFTIPHKAFDTDHPNITRFVAGDFDGDGKTDIYVSEGSVYISDGFRLWGHSIGGVENVHCVVASDLNEDGYSDLMFVKTDGIIAKLFEKGNVIAQESIETGIPATYITPNRHYADSKVTQNEVFFASDSSITRVQFGFDLSKGFLLTKVKTGLNEVTEFEYTTLNGNNAAGGGLQFPYQKIHYNTAAVRQLSTRVDSVPVEIKTFTYQNGVKHRQGLGFRGFEQITVTDSLRNQTLVKTFDPMNFGVLVSADSPASNVTNTWNVTVAENKIAKITLSESVQTDKLKSITVNKSCLYDTLGNVTKETVNYGGGLQTVTDNAYNSHNSDTLYLLGELANSITKNYKGTNYVPQKVELVYNSKRLPINKKLYYDNNLVSEEISPYDNAGNLLSLGVKNYSATSPLTKTFDYDTLGRVSKETDPAGLSVEYVYDGKGLLANTKDIYGKITQYQYDRFGRLTKTTSPLGSETTVEYKWIAAIAMAQGAPLPPENAVYLKTVKTTSQNGAMLAPETTVYYDALWREIRSETRRFDNTLLKTDRQYDSRGRLWKVSLPFKTAPTQWNTCAYDDFDRLLSLSYASGKTDTYSYSGNSVTDTIDGVISTKTYNAAGQLISVTDSAGSITYNYRADGQTESIVTNGATTSFTYDSYGRQLTITDPSAGTDSVTYDPKGNVLTHKNAKNQITTYLYDTLNRPIEKQMPEFNTVYSYNNDNGLLDSLASTNGTSQVFTYDAYGRILTQRENAPDGKWFKKSFSYSSENIQTVAYSANTGSIATETYIYANGHNKEVKLTSSAFSGQKSIWKLTAENAMGQPTAATTGNLNRTYGYDTYGLPTYRRIAVVESAGGGIRTLSTNLTGGISLYAQNFTYSFNAQTGNLNWRKDAMTGRNLQENFDYDGFNRLTELNGSEIYYDSKGNLTENTSVGEFEYNNSAKPYQLTVATPYGTAIPLRNQSITYNAMQRPASITEYNEDDSTTVYASAAFVYNAAGDRVKMTAGGVNNYYFGGKYEIVNSKEILYLCGDAYTAPAVFVKENSQWKVYYIGRDYLGSITHVFKENGDLQQELSYDAWGRLRNPVNQQVYAVGSEPTLFLGRGYTGHEHLTQFGLINMNARLYDPALGRFLSPDPYIQDPTDRQNFNRYSYALNNPLKYTDPSGMYTLPELIVTGIMYTLPELIVTGTPPSPGGGYSSSDLAGFFRDTYRYGGWHKPYYYHTGNHTRIGGWDIPTELQPVALKPPVQGVTVTDVTVTAGKINIPLLVGGTLAIEGAVAGTVALDGTVSTGFGAALVNPLSLSVVLPFVMTSDTKQQPSDFWYVIYTKTNPSGKIYVGRTSGSGTLEQVLKKRDTNHHMNKYGYGPAVVHSALNNVGSAQGYPAMRGREQQLLDFYGGVNSPNVGNSIRAVSERNIMGKIYWWMSNQYFGQLYEYTGK